MSKPDPDEIVELGDSVAYLYHGVDLGEPPANDAEAEAQRDALGDYMP